MPASEALRKDAELLFASIREAGALARGLQGKVRYARKADGSPVSDADLRVDEFLKRELTSKRPSYGWLSEESPDDEARLSCRYLWLLDPIDGTRSFISGGSDWCIAVALIEDGRPVLGAIYNPVRDQFHSALAGEGARLNGRPIHVSDGAIKDARIVGARKALNHLAPFGVRAEVAGELPLQLRLAYVAEGRFDAAISIGPKNDWDLAAGELIVAEAGGVMTDLAGETCVYNRSKPWQQGMLAAGPARHAALKEALKE